MATHGEMNNSDKFSEEEFVQCGHQNGEREFEDAIVEEDRISSEHSHHHHHVHERFHLDDCEADETEEDLEAERAHFNTVLSAFQNYRNHANGKIIRQRQHYESLPQSQRSTVPLFLDQLSAQQQFVNINAEFLKKLLERTPFDEVLEDRDHSPRSEARVVVSNFHMDKVYTTLRMFVRDWSKEGILERQQCYSPLIEAVEKYSAKLNGDRKQVNVLVPGAGLGRLPWELARRGFHSIGNEYSLYMLIASNFILNYCRDADSFFIYPWLGQASNSLAAAHQLIAVSIPDVNPASELPEGHSLGMVAGDFLEVFPRQTQWDFVVTCFFLDTARNILDYVNHIWTILKPGGFFHQPRTSVVSFR